MGLRLIFKTIFVVLVVHIAPCFAYGQEDCAAIFKKAIDQVRSMRLLSKNNGFEMRCRIKITPESGALVEEHVEVIALKNKYRCITSKYSLYQDATTMVVIQHDEKTVFVTRPLPDQLRKDQFTEMVKLQDSLQQHLILGNCTKEFGTVHAGEGYIKITFVPDKTIDGLGLRAITYWVELERYEVKKIAIDYTPNSGYGVKKYELIVDKINAQSTTIPFKNEALAQGMLGDKLRSEFKSYVLIDKRN
jgi:hypothetical protein